MVIPTETIILPLYVQVNSYHWINTWAALIVPFIAKCFSIYMFRQFFLDIPNDLMIIMFIFMQKYYVQGIASTGIKG